MKHFTLAEANEALAAVRPLAERMVAGRRQLARLEPERAELRRRIAGNGGGLDRARVEELERSAAELAAQIAACVQGIVDLGAQVKDLDRGLVDFPARREPSGETVLLCWHLGENEIRFWHGPEEGFAGRKPLPF
jgi:hypothetical protein